MAAILNGSVLEWSGIIAIESELLEQTEPSKIRTSKCLAFFEGHSDWSVRILSPDCKTNKIKQ